MSQLVEPLLNRRQLDLKGYDWPLDPVHVTGIAERTGLQCDGTALELVERSCRVCYVRGWRRVLIIVGPLAPRQRHKVTHARS